MRWRLNQHTTKQLDLIVRVRRSSTIASKTSENGVFLGQAAVLLVELLYLVHFRYSSSAMAQLCSVN